MQQEINLYKTAAKKAYRENDLLDDNAQILPEDKTPTDVVMRRARLLLQDLKRRSKSSKFNEYEKELNALQRELSSAALAKTSDSNTDTKDQFMKVSALARKIALDNPLLDFEDLLFIGYVFPIMKYTLCDQYNPWNINMGGGLFILKTLNQIRFW